MGINTGHAIQNHLRFATLLYKTNRLKIGAIGVVPKRFVSTPEMYKGHQIDRIIIAPGAIGAVSTWTLSSYIATSFKAQRVAWGQVQSPKDRNEIFSMIHLMSTPL
ncbi:hypothetical protein BO78DRAFT_396943 [Aspergillus sclerotiicarbonarius CBS 121057]|uniref:Uncharacterized protein n=1 Tax=Aspergillus sclerotiicarbonarius (strain CBS 121057 / IBT 28362) TaxID=1448318 RepID=A0A319E9N5_ASPSB|nr:hypothetical protein BO78DRAFT_396943 [Aspergillus sclerotiicarbonarius CBS 121057]